MEFDDFRDLVSHRKHRVQRGHGILEDHGDFISAQFSHLTLFIFQEFLPFQENGASYDLSGRIGHQSEKSQCGCGFPSSCFSHQSQCLSLIQRKAHTVYCLNQSSVCNIMYMQIFYFQLFHIIGLLYRFRRGSRASLSPSPRRFSEITVVMIKTPGNVTRCQ
jgi:hypothetical protein